jgi:hypothetical protein
MTNAIAFGRALLAGRGVTDVIQQFPEYFNQNWRDFWGLD